MRQPRRILKATHMRYHFPRTYVAYAARHIFGRLNTGKYFGTDGFRGEAGAFITAEHAFKVGRVLGWYFGERLKGKCRAVIGKDTRLSSYSLEYALAAGITASGGDAYILHVTTTPSLSYITRCDGFDCGIMVSASHNPFYDNGIKLFSALGEKVDPSLEEVIESYLDGDFTPFGGEIPFARGRDVGRTVDYVSGRNRYIGHLISLSTCSYKGMRVGLDGANGSAFDIARSVFDTLGARTFVIGNTPDGTNVNDGVGSTHIEALSEFVKSSCLDLGFAFDGDADRCIAVDSRGRVLTGDEEMYILANYLKSRGELSGKVVCTVLSNGGLKKSLENVGVGVEVCGVGDRTVVETMARVGANLGGERSGHIVVSKYGSTGDGLVTAITLMEAVIDSGKPIDELLKGYKSFPQIGANIPVVDRAAAAARCKQLAARLSEELSLRIVVRPSGTEKVVRIMTEGESEENCRLACEILSRAAAEGGQ